MKDKIIEDLKKTVTENLPELAAGEMKTFIEKAEKAFIEVEGLKEDVLRINKLVNDRSATIQTLNDQISKYHNIETREKNLVEGEFLLAVGKQLFEQEKKLMTANSNNLDRLVSTVFRSPDAKHMMFSLNGSADLPNGQDQYGNNQSHFGNVNLSGDMQELDKS